MRTPEELIEFVNNLGVKKATTSSSKLFVLGVMAGIFIALGAVFFTTVTAFGGHPGAIKLLGGIVFSLGLILVVLGGAELFTGNNLMVISLLNKKIKISGLLKNWFVVYLGNLVGSLVIVLLVFLSEVHLQDGGAIGKRIIEIATAKISLSLNAVFFKAILCNILVCLAVWLTMVAKTISGKVLGIIFPISAFVALGFEHSVANMYFIPIGILVDTIQNDLNITNFVFSNLIPVTLGNIVGGTFFVGIMYWFIYREENSVGE
jgi:formate/nitrite transporter